MAIEMLFRYRGPLCAKRGPLFCGGFLMGSDEVLLIARVRRAMPRNADVLAVCELAERNVSGNVTGVRSATLQADETLQGNVSKECAVCAARREADRARLARHRAKRRG